MKKWEERLKTMSEYDKGYLVSAIDNGWIIPSIEDWHIYCKLKGIDEHPVLTWIKNLFH